MGGLISRIRRLFTRTANMRILMNGLDAAGKTTILYKLKLGEVVTTIPTIGFNVESLEYRNVNFTVWDVGGRDKIRPLYRHYYPGTDALIFVVDSNDAERLDDRDGYGNSAREEIHRAMAEDELRNAPLLVFANKQDLPNALSTSEITQRLGLAQLRGRDWLLQGCCATSGDGLYEGLDWLSEAVKRKGSVRRASAREAPAAAPAPRAVVAAPPAPVHAISSDNPHVFAVKAVEPLAILPPAPAHIVPVAPALSEAAPRAKRSSSLSLRKRTLIEAAVPAVASTPAFRRELQSSPLVMLSREKKSATPDKEPLSAASETDAADPESRSSSSSSSPGAVTPSPGEASFAEGESDDFVVVESIKQMEQPGATTEFGLDGEGAGETDGLVWLDSRGEEVRRRNDQPVALRV